MGEKETKRVKEIVQTNIGPTEKDFLEQVAREIPIKHPTYLAYSANRKALKRTFDYIRSWLIRYRVQYKAINPYLTVYLLDNLPKVSILINKIKPLRKGIVYNPKGTITVISSDEKNFPRTIMEPDPDVDQIVINYIPNMEHRKSLERVFDSMHIRMLDRFCHVKLFEVEKGVLNNRIYEDMMYSCPKFPYLRLGNIGLRR